MEDRMKELFGERVSEIDKWYEIGRAFWLRRTVDGNYLCVQIFPVMDDSYLCYRHDIDIARYEKKSVERFKKNVDEISEDFPADIRYVYPIAFSLDTDKASEMFLASTTDDKDEWLSKMGIGV